MGVYADTNPASEAQYLQEIRQREAQIRAIRMSVTAEMAKNAGDISRTYPSMPAGVVTAGAMVGATSGTAALQQIAERAVQKDNSFMGKVTRVGKGAVRGAMTVFTAAVQETLGKGAQAAFGTASGLAAGAQQLFRGKDPRNTGIAINPINYYDKAGDSALVVAAQDFFGDLGAFTRGDMPAVNLGRGFMPGGSDNTQRPEYGRLLAQGKTADEARQIVDNQFGRPAAQTSEESSRNLVDPSRPELGTVSPYNIIGQQFAATLSRLPNPVPHRGQGSQLIEPGSDAYHLIGGLVDLAVLMKADPSVLALREVGKLKALTHTFSTGERLAKNGMVNSLRKAIVGPTTQEWVAGEEGLEAMRLMAGRSLPDRIWMLSEGGQHRLPRPLVAAIGDVAEGDVAGLSAAIAPYLGKGGLRRIPGGGKTIAQNLSGGHVPLSRRIATKMGGDLGEFAGIRAVLHRNAVTDTNTLLGRVRRSFALAPDIHVSGNDLDGLVNQAERYLHQLNFGDVEKTEFMLRAAKLVPGDSVGFKVYLDDLMELTKGRMMEWGVEEQVAHRVTRYFVGSDELERKFFINGMGHSEVHPGQNFIEDTVMGIRRIIEKPTITELTEILDSNVLLPDPRKLRRAAGDLRTRTDAVRKLLGKAPLPDLEAGVIEKLVDNYMQKAWKPLILLRVAWPMRVIAEEQLRMSVAGLDSVFSHPVSYFAWAQSKKGSLDALGDLFTEGARFQESQSRLLHEGLLHGGRGRKLTGPTSWEAIGKPRQALAGRDKEFAQLFDDFGEGERITASRLVHAAGKRDPKIQHYVEQWGAEMQRFAGDELMAIVARDGYEAGLNWLNTTPEGYAYAAKHVENHRPAYGWGLRKPGVSQEGGKVTFQQDYGAPVVAPADDLARASRPEGTTGGPAPEGWVPGPGDITRTVEGAELPVAMLRDPNRVDLVRGLPNSGSGLKVNFQNTADDIRINGVQNPIEIAVNQDGSIQIIDGTHRLYASELAGYDSIPVHIRYFGGSEAEHGLLQAYTTLTPEEIAFGAHYRKVAVQQKAANLANMTGGQFKLVDYDDAQRLAAPQKPRGYDGNDIFYEFEWTDGNPVLREAIGKGRFNDAALGDLDGTNLRAASKVAQKDRAARAQAKLHNPKAGDQVEVYATRNTDQQVMGQATLTGKKSYDGTKVQVRHPYGQTSMEKLEDLTLRGERPAAGTDALMEKVHDTLEYYASEFGPNFVKGPRLKYSSTPQFAEMYDGVLNRLFGFLMSKPTNYLSRSPAFRQYYWQRMAELVPYMDDATRRATASAAANAGLEDAPMLFRKGGITSLREGKSSKEMFLISQRMEAPAAETLAADAFRVTLEEADDVAKAFALDETQRLLYDLSKTHGIADMARNLNPFGEAWIEITGTWARLLAEHPAVVRQGQIAVEGGRSMGFFTEDPVTGEEVFNYPGMELAFGIGTKIAGAIPGFQSFNTGGEASGLGAVAPLTSFNLFTGSMLPGFGPVVQIPFSHIAYTDDDKWNLFVAKIAPPEWLDEAAKKVITPFGSEKLHGPEDIVNIAMPAWAQRLVQALMGDADPEMARLQGNVVVDVMKHLYLGGGYDVDSDNQEVRLAEQYRLIADAKAQAQSLTVIRGLATFFLPASPQLRHYAADTEGKMWEFTVLAEQWRVMLDGNNSDIAATFDDFVQTFGLDPTIFSTAKTDTIRRRSVTKEGQRAWAQNREELESAGFSASAYYAEPDDPDAEFDYDAYLDQILRGDRQARTPTQWQGARNELAGRIAYEKKIRDLGTTPDGRQVAETEEGKSYLRAFRFHLMEQFPGFRSEIIGTPKGAARDTIIRELYRWETNDLLANSATGVGLKEYLRARDQAKRIAKVRGLKGENSFATADKTNDLRIWLWKIGENLARDNNDFSVLWLEVLSRELGERDATVGPNAPLLAGLDG